ncbi:MAG TPA: hypothetical protein VII92_00555 [Anaerolineae bacterium]
MARFLARFEPEPPFGLAVPADAFTIRDGVNYALPIIVPPELSGQAREEFIQAAIKEATADYHFQFDRSYSSESPFRIPIVDPLTEWDFVTRRSVLASCHSAAERNPIAKAAVKIIRLFTMGEGLTINYQAEDVERILEDFRTSTDNQIDTLEKELLDTLIIDGEIFVRFFSDDNGQTVITPIPAFEIDWIETERGFAKRPLIYHQTGRQSSGKPGDSESIDEEIDADQILHVAINKLSYEVRGRPDLFAILPWLKAYKQWLENRARQNYWRGAILWWLKLIGGTPAQVTNARAQYKQPPPPGSLLVTNDKQELAAVDGRVGASDAAEDGRQMKLMNAVGMLLPEYMLSDGANANLASATAQQLPALRSFTDYQDIATNTWKQIYRRVLEKAIAAGVLQTELNQIDTDGDPVYEDDGTTPKTIDALEAFDIRAPELETSNLKTLADALMIAVNAGWVSNETASAEMGFDYRLERKKIEGEEEAEQQAVAQGRGMTPTDQQPGAPTLADYQQQGGEERESDDMNRQDLALVMQMIQAMGARNPPFSITLKEAEVQLPEYQPPVIKFEPQIIINVPEQAAPIVNVEVPAQEAPRVIIKTPPQPTPIVNVPPDAIRLEVPDETLRVTERDGDGRVKEIQKRRSYE